MNEYIKKYEEYKELYKTDKSSLQKSSFDMPLVKKWDADSVRLRAFLDRENAFYETALAPFEFALKKSFTDAEQSDYEVLIAVYREEFFAYSPRTLTHCFSLDESDELVVLSQEYALYQDTSLLKRYCYEWQKKLDALKSENIKFSDIASLRMKERVIIKEFVHHFSTLAYNANKFSKELASLLSNYSPLFVESDAYVLENYFQEMYDMGDETDLLEYVKSQKTPNIKNDIFQIRSLIQEKISQNNKEAELAQRDATQTTMGEVLLEYASREQEIITLYRTLVAKYFAYLGVEGDFVLINEPFELYFDNYFADFENSLKYYKTIYKELKKPLIHTPYYLKMFHATQAKISILNLNTEEMIQERKKAYISKRHHLTDLKMARREYEQEFEMLLDEFTRYGVLYIKEINSNEYDLEEHKRNLQELKERFDLREEYGFF